MRIILKLLFIAFVLQSCKENIQKRKNLETKNAEKQIISKNNIVSKVEITSFCRFAKIVDKDGYVNVREKENGNSKIIGQIKSDEIVFVFEDLSSDWLNVNYKYNNKELSGYLHRSRIKYINTFEQIPSADYDDTFVSFYLNDISVNIKTSNFDYEANKKYFSKDEEGFDKYKGKFMIGTDGYFAEAKTLYQSITVSVGKQTVKIPKEEIEDLFNANNEYTECYYNKGDNSLYIHLSNSDGSGSYKVLFIIENGIYKGRQIEIPF